ncbi:MAG: VWA domain-containing protein [Hyphomonadaceae bacterium]|nr:VWA domain-containing protein [Hyphomonadaceae bacterium]
MRARRRDISIFTVSALDLFAAALGAFILIVLILFPYYQRGGTDVSMEELEELVQKRRLAASTTQTEMAEIRALEAEIALLDRQYRTAEENMSEVEAELREVLQEIAEIEIPDPPPIPEPDPEPTPDPPQSVSRGVEFSILGLATDEKNIAIVVDMSGSMDQHRSKVTAAINEVLSVLKPDNRFVILGYRGGPTYEAYPSSGRLIDASDANLSGARRFVSGLSRNFGGGTPTQSALMRVLNLNPEAIILMSDGAPDDGDPGSIVANITAVNRGRAEIHTVAIGDYTSDRRLTLFLQELAARNRGDFVGRAR